MKIQSSFVTLENVRFYAYHGVLPQERRVGGWFEVTLRVGYPLTKAIQTDHVDDTVNYAMLFELVRREMMIPSQLLEHVAGRIANAVEQAVPELQSVDLLLKKCNPPMGADSDGAGVELHFTNEIRN